MFACNKLHRLTVRNHIPLESPFLTQDFGQKMIASANRFTIIIIIRAHHAQSPCILESYPERLQIERSHFTRCYVGIGTRLPIASAHRNTVNSKMFGSGNQIMLLKGSYHLFT